MKRLGHRLLFYDNIAMEDNLIIGKYEKIDVNSRTVNLAKHKMADRLLICVS